MSEALQQYRSLLSKVDSLFGEIQGRHPNSFSCRLRCHSCCKPSLTVGPVEAENIRQGLITDPTRVENLRTLSAADPFEGLRCSFLSADGACGIYELRPIVCRTHGLPLQFKDFGETGEEEAIFRDVCPLNFSGLDLSALPDKDVLNLDTLNMILAALNRMTDPEGKRVPLEIDALVGQAENA